MLGDHDTTEHKTTTILYGILFVAQRIKIDSKFNYFGVKFRPSSTGPDDTRGLPVA